MEQIVGHAHKAATVIFAVLAALGYMQGEKAASGTQQTQGAADTLLAAHLDVEKRILRIEARLGLLGTSDHQVAQVVPAEEAFDCDDDPILLDDLQWLDEGQAWDEEAPVEVAPEPYVEHPPQKQIQDLKRAPGSPPVDMQRGRFEWRD